MDKFFKLFISVIFVAIICVTPVVGVINRATDGLLADIFMLKDKSSLEGRHYQGFPKLNFDSLTNLSFQDKFEQFVADQVPDRDDVLVSNATLQRSLIALTASFAGYDVYPTFYGSQYVYDTTSDSVIPLALKPTEEIDKQYEKLMKKLNTFIAKNSSVKTTVCDIDRREYSAANPTSSLMSNTITREYIYEHFFDKLPDTVQTVDLAVNDEETFAKDYFRNDHHWNMYGAYKGYVKTLATLKPDADPVKVNGYFSWDNVPLFGSYSRSGLCETKKPESIVDIDYDASDLKVTIDNGSVKDTALVHKSLYETNSQEEDTFAPHYKEYYHEDYGIVKIENPDCKNGGTLVMVKDSFADCCDRLFAENYSTVYCLDPRFYKGTLDGFLEKHDADDLVFFMSATTYRNETVLDFLDVD